MAYIALCEDDQGRHDRKYRVRASKKAEKPEFDAENKASGRIRASKREEKPKFDAGNKSITDKTYKTRKTEKIGKTD